MRVYLDGSCIEGKVGAAARMFRQGELHALRKHIRDECHHTVYEAEVIRLTLAAEIIARENFIEDAIIGADSQAEI